MKKRFCLLLALLLALSLGGCDDLPDMTDTPTEETAEQTVEESTQQRPFALAYSHDDTLNPFAAATEVNCQLTGLLYEGLMAVDESFVPQKRLAASAEQTDPTHLTVTLRKGAVFSDGSGVTPDDVVASFNEAKRSDRYRVLLTNVVSARVDGTSVTFTLKAADPNATACLTFPIVKEDTLTDDPADGPVGSGVYKIKVADGEARLIRNGKHKDTPPYKSILLQHLPNTASRRHGLAGGDITYYFDDLSEGDAPQTSGASRTVEMNALVFMGVNGHSGKLKDAAVRRALSALLDRTVITRTAYAGRGVASASPFHPHWKTVAKFVTDSPRDVGGAVSLLDEAQVTSDGGARLELELIYSTKRSDRAVVAEQIRTQLDEGGIAVTLTPLSEKEYRDRLRRGKYDLYVGEIRLTADHSLRPLLRGGSASYGISASGAAATAYRQYLSGNKTAEEFMTAFATDMPYIPLCWRSGLAAYDRRLTALTPTGYDPYAGFAGWK